MNKPNLPNIFKTDSNELGKAIKIGMIKGYIFLILATLLIAWSLYSLHLVDAWWGIFGWLIVIGLNLLSMRSVFRILRINSKALHLHKKTQATLAEPEKITGFRDH